MALVLFDGVCNLCNGMVRFIIARDPDAQFSFAALSSDVARRVLQPTSVPRLLPDSVVLVDGGRVFTRSDAALRIARRLRFPWSLAYALVVVPRPLRDWAYDVIARHRYRWFGRQAHCMIPSAEVKHRFLD